MKLAEALITRADYQKRVEQLRKRILMNVKMQEGEKPAEDPNMMLTELSGLMKELTGLIQRINKTNSFVQFDEARTLADALAEREGLFDRRLILAKVAEEASIRNDRYSRTEIKLVSVVDVTAIQKQVDDLSKKYRELDTRIQGMNWTIDLV